MAEYRIVAKIDPQTGAGAQKVKQDLRGVQTEANTTSRALGTAFDQAKFDKAIGGLTGRLDQLDKKLDAVGKSSAQSAKGHQQATTALDRMTAAEFRAAGGVEGLKKAQQGATQSATQQEAALRRVLAAVDAGAAEQLRANALLAEAKRLFDAGKISADQYAAAQRLAAGAGTDLVRQTGSQRIGLQQLGFQLGDVATMYSLGAKPTQIFASQIGQVTQAVSLMTDGTSKFAKFMGGPWGIALTLAVIALSPFVGKLFESSDALDEKIKKMREDARESELTRQANERWMTTLDGLIERTREFTKAMEDRLKVQSQVDRRNLAQQKSDAEQIRQALDEARAEKTRLEGELAKALMPNQGGAGGMGSFAFQQAQVGRIREQIKASQANIDKLQRDWDNANRGIVEGTIVQAELQGAAMVDLTARAKLWGEQYRDSINSIIRGNADLQKQAPLVQAGFTAVEQAISKAAGAGVGFEHTREQARRLAHDLMEGRKGPQAYANEMLALAKRLNNVTEATQKAGRATSDGVARFKSAAQAIGIAGKEFQQAGFRVSENPQFGGVTPGVHEGAGHAQGRAIDINVGKGVVEANVPEIMNRLNAMAVRYAARGYIVLWNGKRYDPSGKVTPYPGHYDHMHLEAPQAIVGKPTQASTETQARQEENQLERVQERAEDFVANVVRQQGMRGIPANAQSQLNAAVADTLKEFETRFNREATAGEKAELTKAFTDADARETARRFEEAYVDPLKRLQDLQGKTGIDRQVLNALLDETKRLGRELTPVEREMIENGIRRGDQLQREAQLLEEVRGPLDQYRQTLVALNALLDKGAISQAAYNARIAELKNSATQTALSGLTGVDPASGRHFEDIAAISEENARYAQQLANLEQFRQAGVDLGASYNAIELEMARQHQQNLANIDRARRDQQMDAMQGIAGSVTEIMRNAFGEQSRIARAAFVAEKAVAVARAIVAIQTGIAQAAALPFPANLPAIASVVAATASIVANIRSATIGYKDGGYITGPGGPRDDKIPIMASNGEFMMNAEATKKFRPLLEKMNAGGRQFADGGLIKEFPVPIPAANDNLGVVPVVPGAAPKPGGDPADPAALTGDALDTALLTRIAEATEGMFELMEEAEKRRKKNRKWNVLKGFLTGGIVGGALTALTEFDKGGWTGDAPTDRETGRTHGQEFVVKAPYARQNRAMLEAINSGRQVRQAQDQRVAQAMGHTMTAAPPSVTVTPTPVRVVIVKDEDEAKRYLDSYEGEAHFVKLVTQNADTVARAAGQSSG